MKNKTEQELAIILNTVQQLTNPFTVHTNVNKCDLLQQLATLAPTIYEPLREIYHICDQKSFIWFQTNEESFVKKIMAKLRKVFSLRTPQQVNAHLINCLLMLQELPPDSPLHEFFTKLFHQIKLHFLRLYHLRLQQQIAQHWLEIQQQYALRS